MRSGANYVHGANAAAVAVRAPNNWSVAWMHEQAVGKPGILA